MKNISIRVYWRPTGIMPWIIQEVNMKIDRSYALEKQITQQWPMQTVDIIKHTCDFITYCKVISS